MNFLRFINWQKNFTKEVYAQDRQECLCIESSGFFITRRQASAISSVIILMFTVILVFGYFWGQRKAIEEFTNKVVNDSFADQVNYSMYSLYGDNSIIDNDEENEKLNIQESNVIDKQKNIMPEPSLQNQGVLENKSDINDNFKQISNTINPKTKYYAQLIGFGSRKAAEQFVNKVQKKGYNVFIVPRKSKTSSGRIITWFQAITDKFDDESKLMDMANRIKMSERLGEIKVLKTID